MASGKYHHETDRKLRPLRSFSCDVYSGYSNIALRRAMKPSRCAAITCCNGVESYNVARQSGVAVVNLRFLNDDLLYYYCTISINQSINQSITLLRINDIHKNYYKKVIGPTIQIHHNVAFECGFLLERVYIQ